MITVWLVKVYLIRCVCTSLTATMLGGDFISPDGEMKNLLQRLATFSSLPESAAVFPSILSKAGFYYTGDGDSVTCCSCGLCVHFSDIGIDPMRVHRQRSPECPLVSLQPSTTPEQELTSEVDSQDVARDLATPNEHNNQTLSTTDSRTHTNGHHRAMNSGLVNSGCNNNIDRFSSRSMKERVDSVDPSLLVEMKRERRRLSTYTNWPRNTDIAPETLAKAGLFYLCRDDRVKCAFCRGILRNWDPSEDPMRKHRRLFPNCPFLRDPGDAGNVILGEEVPEEQSLDVNRQDSLSGDIFGGIRAKYPVMKFVEDRLNTFIRWPNDSHISPNSLAKAGFFYTVFGDVRCFFCDGCLNNSQPEDDLMILHRSIFPECGFMKVMLGVI